jgi:hypothetical protein
MGIVKFPRRRTLQSQLYAVRSPLSSNPNQMSVPSNRGSESAQSEGLTVSRLSRLVKMKKESTVFVIGYVSPPPPQFVLTVHSAGVAGLTTALVLARRGYRIVVVAQHLPGDLTIEYTSPWAAAQWFSAATTYNSFGRSGLTLGRGRRPSIRLHMRCSGSWRRMSLARGSLRWNVSSVLVEHYGIPALSARGKQKSGLRILCMMYLTNTTPLIPGPGT